MVTALKEDAVPSIFEGLPEYYSKNLPPRRTGESTFGARFQNCSNRLDERINEYFALDEVKNLDELESKVNFGCFPNVVKVRRHDSLQYICVMNEASQPPSIEFCVNVNKSLELDIWARSVKVPLSGVASVTTNKLKNGQVCSATDLVNVVSCLRNRVANQDAKTQDTITYCCELLSDLLPVNEAGKTKKLAFLCEQLQLLLNRKTFSADLLSMATLWNKTSPALYRQIIDEGCLSLPVPKTIKRLSESLTVEAGVSSSTVAYLKNRIAYLCERERHIAVIIDEVYTNRKIEHTGGKLTGLSEDGSVAKTLLCILVSSVGGRYRDMVAMVPTSKLSAELLETLWKEVTNMLFSIGFNVVATLTDGHSANRKLFASLAQKSDVPYVLAGPSQDKKVFLLFDSVHLFKNFYTNLLNKRSFKCPNFGDQEVRAEFSHIEDLFYNEEHGKTVKISHKLNDKVMKPLVLERSNVDLANRLFSESTIAGLQFYAERGHEEWEQTASFLKLIRTWFDVMNVKTTTAGIRKRDPHKHPITTVDDENMGFLEDFRFWLEMWRQEEKCNRISDETLSCAVMTSKAMPELAKYLLTECNFDYVLFGQISSDPIEARFGQYRRMSGCNYHVSMRQFFESEKSIRVSSLVRCSGLNMKELKLVFDETNDEKELDITNDSILLSAQLSTNVEGHQPDECDANALYFVAGYLSRSVSRKVNCDDCFEVLVESKDSPRMDFNETDEAEEKEAISALLDQVNRGGLVTPSCHVFKTTVLAWSLLQGILNNSESKKLFLSFGLPRKVFISTFVSQFSEHESMIHLVCKCKCGVSRARFLSPLLRQFFNIMAKNIIGQINDNIHASRKRDFQPSKKSRCAQKALKLSSN